MYRAYGLLRKDTNFNLDRAAAQLVARIPGATSSRSGSTVTIAKGDWSLYIAEVSGPHIPDETVGITDKIAGFERDDVEILAQCDRRVEMWSDDPDPFMEHFNDYLFGVEVLKSFTGLTAVDPNEPALL